MKGYVFFVTRVGNERVAKPTFKCPKNQSYFKTIFNDVLEELGRYYWFFHEIPFSTSSAVDDSEYEYVFFNLVDEFEEYLEKYGICPPGKLFPKHARWITDGNNLLYGFENKPEYDLDNIDITDSFIDRSIDVFLSNQDGCIWECYAKDDRLLKECIKSARKVLDDKYIIPIEVLERDDFFLGEGRFKSGLDLSLVNRNSW